MGTSSNSHGPTLDSAESCTSQPNADISHFTQPQPLVLLPSFPTLIPRPHPTQDQNVTQAPQRTGGFSQWELGAKEQPFSLDSSDIDSVYDLNKQSNLSSRWAISSSPALSHLLCPFCHSSANTLTHEPLACKSGSSPDLWGAKANKYLVR